MNMIDMKRPKEETKVEIAKDCPSSSDSYPYGLEGSLDEDGINKLGIDVSEVEVGEKVMVHAMAQITEVKQEKRMVNGKEKTERSLRWQIQKLNLKFENNFEDSFDEAAKKKDE